MHEVPHYFGYKFSFANRMKESGWLTNYYETEHLMKYDERTGLYNSEGQPKFVRRLNHLREPPEVREIPCKVFIEDPDNNTEACAQYD